MRHSMFSVQENNDQKQHTFDHPKLRQWEAFVCFYNIMQWQAPTEYVGLSPNLVHFLEKLASVMSSDHSSYYIPAG